MIYLLKPTSKNQLDIDWLNRLLYLWVLKWQISATRVLKPLGSYKQVFTVLDAQ